MSTIDTTLTSPIHPFFTSISTITEPPSIHQLITKLRLQKHPEGGYFFETDRDAWRIPNPFLSSNSKSESIDNADSTRNASTTIYYLLTPANPTGHFHRNKGRTVHTLHRGRGRYVIIHGEDKEKGGEAKVETFVVGRDIQCGERVQWVVEGGKYKASFLMPDEEEGSESEGLLISEVSRPPNPPASLWCRQQLIVLLQTVVPGFEFSDHNFMSPETLRELLSDRQADELRWLLVSQTE